MFIVSIKKVVMSFITNGIDEKIRMFPIQKPQMKSFLFLSEKVKSPSISTSINKTTAKNGIRSADSICTSKEE